MIIFLPFFLTPDVFLHFFKTVENKEEVDIRRATVFTAFGALFCGAWQYGLFVKLMPWLCPNAVSFAGKSIRAKLKDVPGMKQLAIQVFIENGINNPILYYPTFYSIKVCMHGSRCRINVLENTANTTSVSTGTSYFILNLSLLFLPEFSLLIFPVERTLPFIIIITIIEL